MDKAALGWRSHFSAVETQSKSAIATWSKDCVFAQILIPCTAYQNQS